MDYRIHEDTLIDIADAIREKLSTEDTYTPESMPEAIRSISGESGEQIYGLRIGKTLGGVLLPAKFNSSHRVKVAFDPYPNIYQRGPMFGQDYNNAYFHVGQDSNSYFVGNGQDQYLAKKVSSTYYGENIIEISNSVGVVFNGIKLYDCNWNSSQNDKYSYSIAFRRDYFFVHEFTFKYMKIYEDSSDVLLYDYVPYKIDDSTYGIYDTVSKTFISTPSTLAEPVLQKYSIQFFDYAFFKKATTYIDVDQNYGDYQIDVDFDTVQYTNDAALFGLNENDFLFLHITTYNNKYYVGPGIRTSDFYSTTAAVPGKHHFTHNEAETHNVIYKNGNDTEIICQYTVNEDIIPNLLKYRVGGRGSGTPFYGKIYSWVLTDNSTGDVVINLVPAQLTDGEITHVGMYDTIHDKFYVNDTIEVGNEE